MAGLYIGKSFDPGTRETVAPFLLDPGDLTTHGIVIGMTGSGKTGLSICLIEELLKARVPVIVGDPKGDMTNLALAFDRLGPDQFEAARAGTPPADTPSAAAAAWSLGLGGWGITAADVAAYASGRTVHIFAAGTAAGVPLNIVETLAWPGLDFEANEEELRDEIDAIVTGLLDLVGVDAGPITGREYILLFNLVEQAWRVGPRPRPRDAHPTSTRSTGAIRIAPRETGEDRHLDHSLRYRLALLTTRGGTR